MVRIASVRLTSPCPGQACGAVGIPEIRWSELSRTITIHKHAAESSLSKRNTLITLICPSLLTGLDWTPIEHSYQSRAQHARFLSSSPRARYLCTVANTNTAQYRHVRPHRIKSCAAVVPGHVEGLAFSLLASSAPLPFRAPPDHPRRR
jgi:hypothetical protein